MAEALALGTGLGIETLRVRYFGRDADALRDISLEVRPGSFVAVAGANGAGKSTLALAAAGLIPRVVRAEVSGRIVIDGEVVTDLPALAAGSAEAAAVTRLTARASHRAGIVFPNPANQLSGTKTSVREELAFGLENLGVPRAEMDPRIDRVLDALGIAGLAERAPQALSGGEQQRVAIAAIVAMALPVLVVDEPTAQLDPLATLGVAELLIQLARDGIAVLAAEHAPEVLERSVRTMVLAGGAAVAFDIPGRALAPESLAGTGLRPPTIVALAAVADVEPERAFDEGAVAAGLERARRARRLVQPLADTAEIVEWTPVRDQPAAAIEIRELVHRYPEGTEAVRGVSLTIPPGEAIAIVGQNGSGKTTLVKHLNGLLRPTAGSVSVAGIDISRLAVHRAASTVGFVFQDPDDQLFSRTVERELRFGPRNLGLSPSDSRRLVEAALRAIGLETDRLTNPYDLNVSGRKLVALGSVVAMDPAVLVLDEPTTGQDGPGVARVGAIVDAFRAAGRTVVAITHDMEFAAGHFDRVVVMRHGEVVADDAPRAIFSPAHTELLSSTGLRPPPAARVAARLGLPIVALNASELLGALNAERTA